MMKRLIHSGLFLLICLGTVPGAVNGQVPIVIPMNFELSGIVREISPDGSQINISGQVFNLRSDLRIHNLVDSEPVAPFQIGATVGYVSNQGADGLLWIAELWVLAVP